MSAKTMRGGGRAADPSTDVTDVAAAAGRIVVGIDGSTGSAAALHWAVEEAQLRGAEVHAVMAWQQPVAIGAASGLTLGMDPAIGAEFVLAAAADAEAEAEAASLVAKAGEASDVLIVCEALEGYPAKTLIRAAEGADLLVVGTRGYGGFVGALVDSVSHYVVAHATCPVVVVANPSRARGAKAAASA
jgi:nucleotide-binding universal stress UspA family protein